MGLFKKIKKIVTKPITDANKVVQKVTGIALPDPNNPLAALGGLMGKSPSSQMETMMDDPMSQGSQEMAGQNFNSYYASTLSALAGSAQNPTGYQATPGWQANSSTPAMQMQGLMSQGGRGGYGYYSRYQGYRL